MAAKEVEVFQKELESSKCYEHAEYTRKEGVYPHERYYFSGQPNYVGKFVSHHRDGYNDGSRAWNIFDKNGTTIRVDYSYEGRTCFREVGCKANAKGGKRRRTSKRTHRNRRKTSRKH
jgi:hypothetical protein